MKEADPADYGHLSRLERRRATDARRAMNRRRFLQAVGLAGTGGAMASIWHWSATPLGFAQPSGDAEILRLVLTLSSLEVAYWEEGLRRELLSGRDLEIAQAIRDHGVEHRRWLVDALARLGAEPVEEPEFRLRDEDYESRNAFFGTASFFEELWVQGVHGLLTELENLEIAAEGAQRVGVKSRHAAIVAALAGENPLVGPVERASDPAETLAAVAPFRGGDS
jgi:hypothetical protein